MKKIIGLFFIFIFVSIISSCFSLFGDGSTVANSYQVSITDYKTEFDTLAVGNVFTVDDDHGKANLNPKAINFNWLSDDTLEISYDKNLRCMF